MRNARLTEPIPALAALLVLAMAAAQAQGPEPAVKANTLDLSLSKPESVGFSSQRLNRLRRLMQQFVDEKQIPGIVTMLARHDKLIDYRAYGVRDMASGAPMTKDAIFRDFSMTKPVTGVAMIILWERGKWLPERSDRQVHSRIRTPEGIQGCGRRREDDPRGSNPSADHA